MSQTGQLTTSGLSPKILVTTRLHKRAVFTPVSKVICICFSFTRVGKVISLFNLKTFTLIVSAHPYYARKFTRHVTFESER